MRGKLLSQLPFLSVLILTFLLTALGGCSKGTVNAQESVRLEEARRSAEMAEQKAHQLRQEKHRLEEQQTGE